MSPKARGRHRTAASPAGYLGRIPPRVWDILAHCWEGGIAVSSNLAREWSKEIALAASLGWISTISLDGAKYLRMWNITAEGVAAYNNIRQETHGG